jgi:putative addiction module component (TIGR02574 family)
MSLPQSERAEVANLLWESVEEFANPEIAAAWDEEIAQRIKDMESGKVESIPAEDVFQRLREKYGVFAD